MLQYLKKRVAAFGYAFKGMGDLLMHHPHAHIHAVATLMVMGLAIYFPIDRLEWALLLLCIGLVWSAEAFNTAIEYLTDLVSPAYHPLAGKTKDMASGAVLFAALATAIVGFLVFYPYLRQYLAS